MEQSKNSKQEVCSVSGFHILHDVGGQMVFGCKEEEKKRRKLQVTTILNDVRVCVCVCTRKQYLSSHTPLTAGDKHRPVLLTTWFINMNFTHICYLFLSPTPPTHPPPFPPLSSFVFSLNILSQTQTHNPLINCQYALTRNRKVVRVYGTEVIIAGGIKQVNKKDKEKVAEAHKGKKLQKKSWCSK